MVPMTYPAYQGRGWCVIGVLDGDRNVDYDEAKDACTALGIYYLEVRMASIRLIDENTGFDHATKLCDADIIDLYWMSTLPLATDLTQKIRVFICASSLYIRDCIADFYPFPPPPPLLNAL